MNFKIGTDITSIERVNKVYNTHKSKFLTKYFHQEEINIFNNLKGSPRKTYLAKRFCGKEAIVKALSEGISGGLKFNKIAILNHDNGAPYVKIDDADYRDITAKISLSDEPPFVVAFAVVFD